LKNILIIIILDSIHLKLPMLF